MTDQHKPVGLLKDWMYSIQLILPIKITPDITELSIHCGMDESPGVDIVKNVGTGMVKRSYEFEGNPVLVTRDLYAVLKETFGLPERCRSVTIRLSSTEPTTVCAEWLPGIDSELDCSGAPGFELIQVDCQPELQPEWQVDPSEISLRDKFTVDLEHPEVGNLVLYKRSELDSEPRTYLVVGVQQQPDLVHQVTGKRKPSSRYWLESQDTGERLFTVCMEDGMCLPVKGT